MNTSSSSSLNIINMNNCEPGDVLHMVLLFVLLFCVVVLVVVAGVQSSLLSRCIVVLLSSCCSCCCYCRWWCPVIVVFFFVVVRRSSSSACHRPPLLVAIMVYCCFALLRIVSHCCSCCSFPSDVQPFVQYSNILVSVLIKIWPHLDATTGEYCCVRVGRNENDVPLWSTAQEEEDMNTNIINLFLFVLAALFVLATSCVTVDGMHASAHPVVYETNHAHASGVRRSCIHYRCDTPSQTSAEAYADVF